jgi:hypothetical protein
MASDNINAIISSIVTFMLIEEVQGSYHMGEWRAFRKPRSDWGRDEFLHHKQDESIADFRYCVLLDQCGLSPLDSRH